MKLRDKTVRRCQFAVKKSSFDEGFIVKPEKFLSRRQARKMCSRPDMILQFAHFLRDDVYKNDEVTIKAQVKASLNGRPFQNLIDPAVNLAKVAPSIKHDKWITSLD